MKALLSLLTLVLFGAVGVASATESSILAFVSSIDWQAESVEVGAPTADRPILVIIEYEKEGICNPRADAYGICRQKKWTTGDPIKPYWGRSRGWGGPSGADSGSCVARPHEFNKNGFSARVTISWQTKASGSGEFKEEFPCKWIPSQTFEKDGFKITVTVKHNE